MVDSVG